MERQGDEIHLNTREARAGGGPRAMRYVLILSIALVIVAFAAIWLIKSSQNPDVTDPAQQAAAASPVPATTTAP